MKNKFWYGVFFGICIIGIMQDALGLEGYLNYVRNTWIPSKITLPIELITGIYCMVRGFKN